MSGGKMSTTEAFDCLDPNGENGFVCPTCGQSYSRAEYLRRHQRKHTEARPFPCVDCSKTFARSDVLLRHRRRVHPQQAQEDEKNKPSPAVVSGLKKPTTRRRNRNVRRPYPAQGNEQPEESGESDPDSPTATDAPAIDTSNGASPDQSIPQPPELSWSGNESSPSGSSSSASPPNVSHTSFSPILPAPQLHDQALGTYDDHVQAMATGPILPPSTISALEAGATAWAIDSVPGIAYAPQHLSRVSSDWESVDYASAYQDKALDLPFVSPDSGEVYDRYMMGELVQAASGAALGDVSVNLLNAEYAILASEGRLRHTLSGDSIDSTNKFYIPPGLFAGCYTVPHWLLPPLQRMSVFASNSFRNIGSHLGVIHEPTFRLADAHAWLAFALCTAAGNKPYKTRGKPLEQEPWDAVQSVVRTEKTGMFVKLFARAGSKLPAAETFSGIQALLIYNAQSFLSDNAADRIVGDLFLSTISKISRRSGVFDPDADWAKPNLSLSADIGGDWLRWVRSESSRRTIWLVYLLDVQSSLEGGAVPLVSSRDVRHLPIPASDTFWNAPSAITWCLFATHPTFSIFTLDDAMQKLFDFSAEPENIIDSNARSHSNNNADQLVTPSLLDVLTLGPFARLVIVITILRGLIEYGEGKHRGGYVVQRWITGGQNGHFAYTGDNPELFHEYVMKAFTKALVRWKNGWDFDNLCPKDTHYLDPKDQERPIRLFNQDAMPFYWMCQLLLTHMTGSQVTLLGENVPASSPRRWADEIEDGEGQRRLSDIDLASTFTTAKGVADPFSMAATQ